MKKIIFSILILTLLAPTVHAANSANRITLQKIVDKLDVTSFNNSFGPRREKNKVTLRDYGASKSKFDDKKVVVSSEDDSWKYTITLLDGKAVQTEICFEDQAFNGGSYHSQEALSLNVDKSGFLKASAMKNDACPKFAK